VTVGGQTSNARPVVISGSSCILFLTGIVGGAAPGDPLLLEGTGFDSATPANNVVRFTTSIGSVIVPILQEGRTQLHVRIPDLAIDGDVTVSAGGKMSNVIKYHRPAPQQ